MFTVYNISLLLLKLGTLNWELMEEILPSDLFSQVCNMYNEWYRHGLSESIINGVIIGYILGCVENKADYESYRKNFS